MTWTSIARVAISCALASVLVTGCSRGTGGPSPELEALLEKPPADMTKARGAAAWRDLREFYKQRGHRLAWVEKSRPARRADTAIAVLADARAHALDPDDDARKALTRARAQLDDRTADDDRRTHDLAAFDVRLTHALLRLGRDVALGRTSPAELDRRGRAQRRPPPLGAMLERAITGATVAQWLEQVAPPHPEYRGLRRAWAALSARGDTVWPVLPRVSLRPGQRHAAVPALRARLVAGGELATADAADPQRYDPALAGAVRAFQEHHGLDPSGVVDAATVAALNVPLAERRRQVALNLERWRWMPDDLGARHVRVNIPKFYLEVYEQGRAVLGIRAVVGKTGDETPVFSDVMTHVVFSPYWNIPESIASEETLPEVVRDPGYLERHDIEAVRRGDDSADPIDPEDLDWTDPDLLKSVALRQRPGKTNALGFVKFMFPNPFNVYIHDTPADGIFERGGRSASHGCIRIEDPMGFATYVLRDQPDWTRPAIEAAMYGGVEKHLKLATSLPVHIVYFTAWTDEQGGLHFRPDVYGFDAKQAGRWRNGAKAQQAALAPGRPRGREGPGPRPAHPSGRRDLESRWPAEPA